MDESAFSGERLNPFKQNPEAMATLQRQVLLRQLQDEFAAKESSLKPLVSVVVGRRNFDQDIQERLTKIEQTRGCEVSTSRVAKLQELADKMTEGMGIQTRVMILNRGEHPEAFVVPDGTICLSQSLINKLDTLDEVAAVVAHEIDHLRNKTFVEKVNGQSMFASVSVSWLHEIVGDLQTPAMLARVGLNSMAFSSAIIKAGGQGRDYHEGSLSRASQIVGYHYVVDSNTSSVGETPLPSEFSQPASLTNREVLDKALKSLSSFGPDELKKLLHDLSGEDLDHFTYRANHRLKEQGQKSWTKQQGEVYFDELARRLRVGGFNDDDVSTMLTLISMSSEPGRLYRGEVRINSPDDFIVYCQALAKFDREGKYRKGWTAIINEDYASRRYEGAAVQFLGELSDKVYSAPEKRPWPRIPVNDDSLIDGLASLSKTIRDNYPNEVDRRGYIIPSILKAYIWETYESIPKGEGLTVDEDQIYDLFVKCRRAGLDLNEREFRPFRFGEESDDPRVRISRENGQIIFDALVRAYDVSIEAPKAEQTEEDLFLLLEREYLNPRSDYYLDTETFIKILGRLRQFTKVDEEESVDLAVRLAMRLSELINKTTLESNVDMLASLEKGSDVRVDPSEMGFDRSLNQALIKLNLNVLIGLRIFRQDSDQFYKYIDEVVASSGVNLAILSLNQLINVSEGFFKSGFCHVIEEEGFGIDIWDGRVRVDRLDKLTQTPFLREVILRLESATVEPNLESIVRHIDEFEQHSWAAARRKDMVLFDDNVASALIYGSARKALITASQRSAEAVESVPNWMDFISAYFEDSPQKNQILRAMRQRYLTSGLPLRDKLDFLKQRLDGQGIKIVADGIVTLEDWRLFEQTMGPRLNQELSGSEMVTKTAAAEILSSLWARDHDKLFNSAKNDQVSQHRQTNEGALKWLDQIEFHESVPKYPSRPVYNVSKHQVVVQEKDRGQFFSYGDLVGFAKGLGSVERLAIVHKALADAGGALTSVENKSRLAEQVVVSLGLPDGFVKDIIRCLSGLEDDHSKMIVFPLAQMMGPLVFRALDLDRLDPALIGKERVVFRGDQLDPYRQRVLSEIISEDEIRRLLESGTREIVAYSTEILEGNNPLVERIKATREDYARIQSQLLLLWGDGGNGGQEMAAKIGPFEAVISAVEASGPVGTRSLQLARQLRHFSPEIDARLAKSFDRNPGMSKGNFWLSLTRLMEEQPDLKSLVEKNLVSLDEYLGGGSLFTTFAATVKNDDGGTRRIAIKLLRPNAEAFVKETDETIKAFLDTAEARYGNKYRSDIQLARGTTEFAREWCLADIADPNFVAEDETFRYVISRYNKGNPEVEFFAPEVVYNSVKCKIEELVEGPTVNRLLEDKEQSVELEQGVVAALKQFFNYQMTQSPMIEVGQERFRLCHSDPHVGNYIVETSSGRPRIAVIDRSMYLRAKPEDINVVLPLMDDQADYTGFIDRLLDRLFDQASVTSMPQRMMLKGKVMLAVGQEYLRQSRGRNGQGINKFALLQTALGALPEEMEPTLTTMLLIRNVSSMRELHAPV